MELLLLLLQRHGELVSREEIRAYLWGKDVFLDVDHSINTAIRKVRLALHDDPDKPRFIETVVGKGYRFAAPVTYRNGDSTHRLAALQQIPDSATRSAKPGAVAIRARMLVAGSVTLALIVVGWALYRSGQHKGVGQSAIRSLAVLPLKNLSGDPMQEYLADGMTEDLVGRLSRIHDLRVISRTSVMRFKTTQLSVPEIAKALQVDAIVEGSIIREGSRVRVHAQLIRGSTDEHFWSESYDRELRDMLSLQSDVAQSIASKVEVTVTGKEHERLSAVRSVPPEVYESYLKGEFSKGDSKADVEKRIGYFEAAINKDPTFAPAYLGLAEAYSDLGAIFVGGRPDETRPKVISAAQKALDLDPNLAEAHALLADVYQERWRWADAEAEYRRALELNPNDVAAHLGFAHWLLCQGRTEEALAWSRRAQQLDPLGVTGVSNGWILFHARRYDEAMRELRSVLAVHPDYATARWFLGFVLIGSGRSQEAIPLLEKTALMMKRSPGSIELLATAYARAGQRTQALRLIDELKRRQQAGYVPAGAFINPYLGLGDYDQAFFWMEQAYQEQSNILQFLRVHPFFDPVRSDPRFADLERRVGLAQ